MTTPNPASRTWDGQSGLYLPPKLTWQVDLQVDADESDMPDIWLSRPGGEYHVGASLHFPPFNFPSGAGRVGSDISYGVSPFFLHHSQDLYNSWNVSASSLGSSGCMDYWDWLPGILLVDESKTYTLPNVELSAYAGTEWADNDLRVFHGIFDGEVYAELVRNFLHAANQITGPGWANWPFGQRQLEHAVMCWIRPGAPVPEVLLLMDTRQSGAKFCYRHRDLYDPGETLGAWQQKPTTWDCRQAMRFIYQAALLADDGLPELSIVSAIAALENAASKILLFLTGGNSALVQSELSRCKFLSRFDRLLPRYGATLPSNLFDGLKTAYFARNSVAHALTPISQQNAATHVRAIEDVLAWYLRHV